MSVSKPSRDLLDAAKHHLRDYLIHIGLDPNKNMHCLSGTHPDVHPSMSLLPDETAVFCHSCQWQADLVNVIAAHEGLKPNSKDAIDRAIAFASVAPRGTSKKPKSTSKNAPASPHDRQWTPALKSKVAVDYLHERGFSGNDKDIIIKYKIAFDKKNKCLIIPHDGDYFTARAVGNVDKAARFCHNPATPVTLFNGSIIGDNDIPIIAVTEGAIDALSLIACNLPAVALGGAASQAKFLKALANVKPVPDIIVAFDNDKAGNDNASKLFEKILQKFEVGIARLDLKDATDVNELFINNRAQLQDSITNAIKAVLSFKNQAYAPTVPHPVSQTTLSNPKAIARQMIVNRYGLPVANAPNFDLVFEHDPVANGLVAFNELSNRIEITKCPPWRRNLRPHTPWQDTDDHALMNYIDRTYALSAKSVFMRVIDEYAFRRSFHPIRDFFNTLPAWDGTPRAETLLIDNLGANDTPYMRAITKNWLLAAVSRIFNPGCKFDYCLVLKGKQGIGKSTLLQRLGGEWFGELTSIQGKDAIGDLQGLWIVELVEMQATKKAENEQIKSFLSTKQDRARLAYDKRTSEFLRQSVFAATTNEHEFLHDQTGGRRFWIAELHAEHYAIRADFDPLQVWAEILHIYNETFADGFDSFKLDLPYDLKFVATELQTQHTDGSDLRGRIAAFLDRPIPMAHIWQLLSQEERRYYFKRGKVALPLPRIEYSKSNPELVEALHNFVSKDFDGNEYINITFDTTHSELRFLLFDEDPRRDIVSPVELANELFYDDKLPVSNRRIADIMRTLDGWKTSKKRRRDAAYGIQNTVFERIPPQE